MPTIRVKQVTSGSSSPVTVSTNGPATPITVVTRGPAMRVRCSTGLSTGQRIRFNVSSS